MAGDEEDFIVEYKRAAGLQEETFAIIMDPYATVAPEEFSEMWSALRYMYSHRDDR